MIRSITMGTVTRMSLALALVASIFAGSPTSAEARPTSDLVDSINITGVAEDVLSQTSSTITGVLDISGLDYDPQSGLLLVTGTISGLATGDGVTTQIFSQLFTTSGTLTGSNPSGKGNKCEILNLDLGPLNLDLLGLQVDLSDVQLDIAGVRGPGKLLGNLLCALTGLLDGPLDKIEKQLARINSIIGNPLENIIVQGLLPDNGNFTGFLNIDSISVDQAGNLVFTGVLNGILTNNSLTTTVTNLPISTSGTLVGGNSGGKGNKCQILFLDLAPINLDLLGLQVDLSQVTLDLTAVTGSGNLLGNLLCKITKILDGNSDADKLVKQLTKSVQKLNQLLL